MSSLFIAEFSLLLLALVFLAYGLFKIRQPYGDQPLVNTSQEIRLSVTNQFRSGKN